MAVSGLSESDPASWLGAIRRYALVTTAANVAWEAAQLPLYTIWSEGSAQEIVVAVLHCTAGDLVIASGSLIAALALLGGDSWPRRGFALVAVAATAIGVLYTVYSERSNLARGAWAYSEAMPVVPLLRVGLSPLLQWLLIPALGFGAIGRSLRK